MAVVLSVSYSFPQPYLSRSESSLFDFGSISEPFSATNHARIGQSTLLVHDDDDDGLLLCLYENTIA